MRLTDEETLIAVSVMREDGEQPTAYDADKVVAELTKRAEESGDLAKLQDGYYAGMEAGFRQAIQIVKGAKRRERTNERYGEMYRL